MQKKKIHFSGLTDVPIAFWNTILITVFINHLLK